MRRRLSRWAPLWRSSLSKAGAMGDGGMVQLLRQRVPLEVAAANDVGADAVEGILGRLKYGSAA